MVFPGGTQLREKITEILGGAGGCDQHSLRESPVMNFNIFK